MSAVRPPRRRDYPSDAPAARRAREQRLRAIRIAAGTCEDCDVPRGEHGTGTRCRGCADATNASDVRPSRHARRVAA